MIIGKLNGFDFVIQNEEVLCEDLRTRNLLRNICDITMYGFKTYYGEPELYILDKVKKLGAISVKYADENLTENLIY